LSGVIVAALAMGGALLLEGTSPTGGVSNAPPLASARQVTPTNHHAQHVYGLSGCPVRQPHFVTFAAFPLVKAVYLLES